MIRAWSWNVAAHNACARTGQVRRAAQEKIREAVEGHASNIQAWKSPIPDIAPILEPGANGLPSARQRNLIGKLILIGGVACEIEIVRARE